MSDSTSITVAQVLAGLGITTFAGDVMLEGVRSLSTSVNVAAGIQTLMVLDSGASSATTAVATLTSASVALAVADGVQGLFKPSADGKTIAFSGTLDQINTDLKLLSYLSSSAVNDTVTLVVTDDAGNSGSASFGVTVLPIAINAGAVSSTVTPTSLGQNASLSGINQIYTADDRTDIVTSIGTATSVVGGGAGSSLTLLQSGGSYVYTNKAGSATVVAHSASGTIQGGAAGSGLVAFLQGQSATYMGGYGNDELVGGDGAMTVNGGLGGSLTVFGGAGTLEFTGGHGSETVVGGAGAETIHAAAAGGAYFGGAGGSQMFAIGPGSFLIGDVSGDVMTASAFGGDGLVAGTGNETLNGGSSRWENVLFGGTGHDVVMLGEGADTFVGGSGADTIQMGAGSAALFTGAGADLFSFEADHTRGVGGPGSDTISGFRVGEDELQLSGGLAVTRYASTGGVTSLQLTDGTQIHLANVSGVSQSSLFG